jgi:hypothetical protein
MLGELANGPQAASTVDVRRAVRDGRRRRRTRRMLECGALVTAAAVIVAVAGAAVGTHAMPTDRGDSPQSSAGHGVLKRPKPVHASPIDSVWPEAVHRLPDTLSDGRAYRPWTLVDGHTMVVTAHSGKTNAVYTYDLRTHAVKRLAEAGGAQGFTAGSGTVVWWRITGGTAEIWAVPASGGTAHRVVVQRGIDQGLTRVVVDGGDVVWSADGDGGVYRAPLAGGTPQQVPGSAGMHILAWPWIGKPYGLEGVGEKEVVFEDLLNTRTGEKRTADLTDRDGWGCGLAWCIGGGPAGASEAQRRDGSRRHAIPNGQAALQGLPLLDRFVVTYPSGPLEGPRGNAALYDLNTGRMGDLSFPYGADGLGVDNLDPTNRLVYAQIAGEYLIIDLQAIS